MKTSRIVSPIPIQTPTLKPIEERLITIIGEAKLTHDMFLEAQIVRGGVPVEEQLAVGSGESVGSMELGSLRAIH